MTHDAVGRNGPHWGAVADDFTGATDLAASWVARGLRTAVTLGIPTPAELPALADMDAVVVALKTRTAPPAEAVARSLAALDALRRLGCARFYDKYCSTFDSTPTGNIGPVADALTAALDTDLAVVVPSFPANGRTVYQGHLFVGDRLLSESSMRHHPLTPMTDADLVRVLTPQTVNRVVSVPLPTVRQGQAALAGALRAAAAGGRCYAVVDAVDDDDLATIAAATADHPLVTGGSGLALGLPAAGPPATAAMPVVPGRRAVLAGSASAATRGQIAAARDTLAGRRLDVPALRADPAGEVAAIARWAEDRWAAAPDEPVLVYAVGSLDDVETTPPPGQRPAAELVEEALAGCAVAFAAAGARQFLVAGGETSGSVVGALGVRRLELGPALAPGVSWAHGTSTNRPDGYNLALKSGNFGAPDIFTTCWKALS
ncbi:3-oxo-tetronate kinase [Streptomyces mayteni]